MHRAQAVAKSRRSNFRVHEVNQTGLGDIAQSLRYPVVDYAILNARERYVPVNRISDMSGIRMKRHPISLPRYLPHQ